MKTGPLEGPLPWTHRPSGDVLYAAGGGEATERAVAALGGRLVASRRYLPYGQLDGPRWALYRIPGRARAVPRSRRWACIRSFRPGPAETCRCQRRGSFQVATGGGVRAWLDGQAIFPLLPDGPGAIVVRLAKGPHELRWNRLDPRGSLTLTGPDGFVIPFGEEPQPPRASRSAS